MVVTESHGVEAKRYKAQVLEEYTTTVRNRCRQGWASIVMAVGELAVVLMQNGEDLHISEEGGMTPTAEIEYYAYVTSPALATYIKTRFG